MAGTEMDGPKLERCWQSGGGYDCLLVDEVRLPQGRIVTASRQIESELPTAPGIQPLSGFSCAIYPSGIIEQRVIGSGGDFSRNDSADGRLWDSGAVRSLLARGEADPEGQYVDCAALSTTIENMAPEAVRTADRGALGMSPASG